MSNAPLSTEKRPSEGDPVALARAFAVRAHAAQISKHSEQPYVVHLDSVVRILQSFGIEAPPVLAATYARSAPRYECGMTIGAVRPNRAHLVVGVFQSPLGVEIEKAPKLLPESLGAKSRHAGRNLKVGSNIPPGGHVLQLLRDLTIRTPSSRVQLLKFGAEAHGCRSGK